MKSEAWSRAATTSTPCGSTTWLCGPWFALRDDPEVQWPDLLLHLGDQVYADTTPHPELDAFMAARRDLTQPPGTEIKDFVEYCELYWLASSEDAIRWPLSTVPSAMIFDDHDIRDDWNTSWAWRREIRDTSWWQERIVSGLAAYWVYQHIGTRWSGSTR